MHTFEYWLKRSLDYISDLANLQIEGYLTNGYSANIDMLQKHLGADRIIIISDTSTDHTSS